MSSLVITGLVTTLDGPKGHTPKKATVWIREGLIAAVTAPTAVVVGFDQVPRVDVGNAFILPGFTDLHNHVGYHLLGLWSESTRSDPWKHNGHWPNAASYQERVTWPAACWSTATPEALLAYIQVRALAGGTTSQQGWPTASKRVARALRNIDADGGFPGRTDPIETSVGALKVGPLTVRGQRMAQGIGFVYHCAEGQPESVVTSQFDDAKLAGVLAKTFIGVHCCGVTAGQWKKWSKESAGAIAWSPFSNYWLYGITTNIPAAAAQGVAICLGSDWGPSGTKNLLGELKVAKLASTDTRNGKAAFGLTDDDLLDMITVNPGTAVGRCWNCAMGRIVPGALADLTVIRKHGAKPVATQVVQAKESDVALVVIGGVPRYGTDALMKQAAATDTFSVPVGTETRVVSLPPRPASAHMPHRWTWDGILAELQTVIDDPEGTVTAARARRNAFAGRVDDADAPLILTLDMPGGSNSAVAGVPSDFTKVEFGPIPSLIHDDAFFDAVESAGFQGKLFHPLRGMF